MHNWSDGEVQSTYPLGDYKSKFGTVWKFTRIKHFKSDIRRIITIFIALIFTKNLSSPPLRHPEMAHSVS
jgi:hypothetical protein